MHMREVVLKNRDGKRILGMVRTPDGTSKGTVVIAHGLGGWKEQSLFVISAEELCKHGYNVFSFDGADGAKAPDGDFTHSTTTDFIKDLDEVVTYVMAADWYAGPLILLGHSLGGMSSLHYARMHPARVSKLILIAPAVSWKQGLISSLPLGLWWLIFNKNKAYGPDHRRIPLDRAWLLDFMKYDMKRDAPYVSAPTLIITAGNDGTIASPRAHEGLVHRFPRSTWITIPHARHVFIKHEHKVADTITKWLTSS